MDVSDVPRRFQDTIPPDLWGMLMSELWAMILDSIRLYERKGMVTTSRWFRNLFWDNRRSYNISTPVQYDIPKVLGSKDLTQASLSVCRLFDLSSSDVFSSLRIYHVQLGDAVIRHLVESCFPSKIQHLHLEGCGITGKSMIYISRLASLRSLTIKDNAIKDVDMVHISALTSLKEIDIEECNISDISVLYLSALKYLEICTLSYYYHIPFSARVTDKIDDDCSLSGLANKPLVSLSLCSSPVTLEGLKKINTSTLKVLKMKNTNFLDPSIIGYLATITSLERLHFSGYDLEVSYAPLTLLTNLKELVLSESMINDDDLVQLTMPKLELLNISFCKNITDLGLNRYTMLHLSPPKSVLISGCTSLSVYAFYDCLYYDESLAWKWKPLRT